jgi:hypothetical protein
MTGSLRKTRGERGERCCAPRSLLGSAKISDLGVRDENHIYRDRLATVGAYDLKEAAPGNLHHVGLCASGAALLEELAPLAVGEGVESRRSPRHGLIRTRYPWR